MTVRGDARAIRSHRAVLGIVALLILAASLWSAYSTLHGLTKVLVTAISAGLGAYVFVWLASWPAAAVIARPRQRREAVRQRDKANETINRMMGETQGLQTELGNLRNQVAVLTHERDAAIKERDDASEQLLALNDPTRTEGLRVAIDKMVKRGFDLYNELNTGPEPTETDEEGRGISFPFWPPDAKWDPVYEFAHEANELLNEYDPGLLFAYADGINAARRKLRRRERQRDDLQGKLPSSEQMKTMVERLHRRPAEELECYVNALVNVKKEL